MRDKIANIILIVVFGAIYFISCVLPVSQSSFYVTDVSASDSKKIALTFDDGPFSETTPRLLDGLKERNVKATFFVTGENVISNPEIIKRMYEEGHLIGNHTHSHSNLSTLSCLDAKKEINQATEAIYSITGYHTEYLRPPFGNCCDNLASDYFLVLWDVDPIDWSTKDKNRVVNHVIASAKDGDIILLHDMFDSSVDAALEIIDILSSQGFEFVTVDELLNP